MNSGGQSPSLGEAASQFLASLSPEESKTSQQEIYRFVRWYGWERPVAGLIAPEVANYAERLSLSDTDYMRKLELVRAFLIFARKQKWSQTNLASHLKTRKGKAKSPPRVRRGSSRVVSLTQQGYAELEDELAVLKGRRSQAVEQMRNAAADKDFRENAPLEAAREEHGRLVGRIKELEEVMKSAAVIDESKATPRVSIGDSIVLRDVASGEELRYTLVSPREVDPTRGKISGESPVGRAIMGRDQGDVVEVVTPAGKLRYQIGLIEH